MRMLNKHEQRTKLLKISCLYYHILHGYHIYLSYRTPNIGTHVLISVCNTVYNDWEIEKKNYLSCDDE